jgi:hypothetical protein
MLVMFKAKEFQKQESLPKHFTIFQSMLKMLKKLGK